MTRNRHSYLNNCVDSIKYFSPDTDLIIFDDRSDDPDQINSLLRHENDGVEVVRNDGSTDPNRHGGLYHNMNLALELAHNRGYQYLQILQDDQQMIAHDPDLLARLRRVSQRHQHTLHISTNFAKKISYARSLSANRFEWDDDPDSYHITPYSVSDTGFIHVERAIAAGLVWDISENATSELLSAEGWKSRILRAPTVTFVPWPRTLRNKRQITLFPPFLNRANKQFFLKPITNQNFNELASIPENVPPFAEDYTGPWEWWCITPFWYTRWDSPYFWKQYVRELWNSWKHGFMLIPRITRRR